jgi:hypothetical protein
MLAYLRLFSVLPSHARSEAISATNLAYLTDAENWILVAAVSLRLLSNPTPERRRFYRTLSPYLWVNAVAVLIMGYPELERGWLDGLQDAAWGLPELTLCASFARSPGIDPCGMLQKVDSAHGWSQLAVIESPRETTVAR